jgi:hypothetical protein
MNGSFFSEIPTLGRGEKVFSLKSQYGEGVENGLRRVCPALRRASTDGRISCEKWFKICLELTEKSEKCEWVQMLTSNK